MLDDEYDDFDEEDFEYHNRAIINALTSMGKALSDDQDKYVRWSAKCFLLAAEKLQQIDESADVPFLLDPEDPDDPEPPYGETLIVGTDTGTITMSKWDDEGHFVGWMRKPKFTQKMQQRFRRDEQ